MAMDLDQLSLFARSVSLGFAVAAPVGPMALLCIERSLRQGAAAGLLSGCGVAAADASYAAVAAAGLGVLTRLMVDNTLWFQGFGSLVLLGLGWHSLTRGEPPATADSKPEPPANALASFATAYLLTIANPQTVLFFASVLASLGASGVVQSAILFPLGVFLGSMAWWIMLVAAVRRGRQHLGTRQRLWINRGSGLLLVGYAVVGLRAALTTA